MFAKRSAPSALLLLECHYKLNWCYVSYLDQGQQHIKLHSVCTSSMVTWVDVELGQVAAVTSGL